MGLDQLALIKTVCEKNIAQKMSKLGSLLL